MTSRQEAGMMSDLQCIDALSHGCELADITMCINGWFVQHCCASCRHFFSIGQRDEPIVTMHSPQDWLVLNKQFDFKIKFVVLGTSQCTLEMDNQLIYTWDGGLATLDLDLEPYAVGVHQCIAECKAGHRKMRVQRDVIIKDIVRRRLPVQQRYDFAVTGLQRLRLFSMCEHSGPLAELTTVFQSFLPYNIEVRCGSHAAYFPPRGME